jgi:hypothetical protein
MARMYVALIGLTVEKASSGRTTNFWLRYRSRVTGLGEFSPFGQQSFSLGTF